MTPPDGLRNLRLAWPKQARGRLTLPKKRKTMFPKELISPKTKYLENKYLEVEKELRELVELKDGDASVLEMVGEEEERLNKERDEILEQARHILEEGGNKSSNSKEPHAVILEVRAGTGGDEAGIFASDLLEMYQKYAASQGWKTQKLSESKNSLGGYKEAVIEISGKEAHKKLKHESGVHRIQRVPVTEKTGRIHTSTASVAIFPERENENLSIKPEDLEVSFTHSGGPGGQNVNKVETAVRVLHKPTGIVVLSQNERSQAKNKDKALSILSAKIGELKREEEERSLAKERKDQIGIQSRTEKIRTYNVLQDRVTDHRIKKSWHNIESIFAGGIDSIIESCAAMIG